MSNKRYRTPASDFAAPAGPADALVAAYGPVEKAAPAESRVSAADAALLESVKEFLGKLVRRASEMMDELPTHPGDEPFDKQIRANRRDQVGRVARVGIAACRALMSAMRMTGTDTAKARKLIDETMSRLQQRMERLQPAA